MPATNLIDIFSHALFIVMMTVGLLVLPGLIVGLLIAMFQAATQINDLTLNFLPKLFAILVTIALAAPWLFHLLTSFTQTLFAELPFIIH